ncbi:MAG: hypothetical protein ACR2PR_03460 [Pseudohongiellaceae bacterium]
MPKHTKAKKKKQTSFGQFDGGRGQKAARSRPTMSSDPRTITGQRLTKRQRQNIARQNARRG